MATSAHKEKYISHACCWPTARAVNSRDAAHHLWDPWLPLPTKTLQELLDIGGINSLNAYRRCSWIRSASGLHNIVHLQLVKPKDESRPTPSQKIAGLLWVGVGVAG